MWNIELESKIVENGRRANYAELDRLHAQVLVEHKLYSYMINRFLDEYGDQLDESDKCMNMYKYLSDGYNQCERLLRITKSYDKR